MLDRLAYAMIGFVLGSLLGVLLWWAVGVGGLTTRRAMIAPDLWMWLKYSGGAGALVGLLFKDRVGTAIGMVLGAVFDSASGNPSAREWHAPRWFVVAVLVLAVLVAVCLAR